MRVRHDETDAAGIVFFANFFVWFDRATHDMLAEAGHDVARSIRETGIGVPLLESGARFHAPLYHDDVITIKTGVTEVRTRAFRLEHEVRRGEELIATGHAVRIFGGRAAAGDGLRTQPIPESVRAWLLANLSG